MGVSCIGDACWTCQEADPHLGLIARKLLRGVMRAGGETITEAGPEWVDVGTRVEDQKTQC
jgi:hypothetical protein